MAERQPPTYLASSCYEMSDLRLEMQDLICQEGVAFHTSAGLELKVSPSVTALNVTVASGGAFISSSYSEAGIYHVWNDAAVEVTLDTPDVTNRRIDTIVARVIDPEFESGDAGWALDSLTGTPSATIGAAPITDAMVAGAAAFLADLTGITCIVLGYVLVNNVAAQTGVPFATNQILDVRDTFETCGPATTPYCALVSSGSTTPITVAQKVDLATTVHVDDAFYTVAASVITILKAGLYDVACACNLTSATTAAMEFDVTKNGTSTKIEVGMRTGVAAMTALRGSPSGPLIPFVAGDNIRLTAASTSSATATNASRLVIRKVG